MAGGSADSAGKAGVEGCLPGVHRGLRNVINDTTINALFNQQAKLLLPSEQWQNMTVIS